jgi:hypothetical protein
MIEGKNAGDAVEKLLASLSAKHPALAAELQP